MTTSTVRFSVRRLEQVGAVFIGNERDNLAERIQFVLPARLAGAAVFLHLGIGDYTDVVELDAERIYAPARTHTQFPGRWTAYLEAYLDGDVVWHSDPFILFVGDLPDDGERIEQAYPTAIEEALRAVDTLTGVNARAETLEPGSEATVELEEDDAGNRTIVYGIPRGHDGSGGSADGGYYKPAVTDAGDLSWEASKAGMPAVPTTNIKGPQGAQGEKGDTGETGPQGPAGEAGHTPVRGTDYWTDADRQEMREYIDLRVDEAAGGADTDTGDDVPELTWQLGTLTSAAGAIAGNDTRMYSSEFAAGEYVFTPAAGTKVRLYAYSAAGVYLGGNGGFATEAVSTADLALDGAATYRLLLAYTDDRNMLDDSAAQEALTASLSIAAGGKKNLAESVTQLEAAAEASSTQTGALRAAGFAARSLAWEIGGIQSADGSENTLSTRARTAGFVDTLDALLTVETGYKALIYYYTMDGAYIGASSGWLTETTVSVAALAPTGAAKCRILAALDTDGVLSGTAGIAAAVTVETHYLPDKNALRDVPGHPGVWAALANIAQMAEIRFTPKAAIPQTVETIPAGEEFTGIPYSSSRVENLFVPNFVSFATFMSAVQNPNSYLYTEDLSAQGNVNGKTWYGAVCSTAVGYALGLVPNYPTAQWTEIPGMEVLEYQTFNALMLCDTIVGDGHVVMVTEIWRTARGKISAVQITEAAGRKVQRSIYAPEKLAEKYPLDTYTLCRYSPLYLAEHEQSPYVAVEDETPQTVTYPPLLPRRGDKCNILAGADVVLDVLDAGAYTGINLYKDGALLRTESVADSVTLTGLAYGTYAAALTDGTAESDACHWIVVDADSTAAPVGSGGAAQVTFGASNATPVFVSWAKASDNGTDHCDLLTAEQIAAGRATVAHEAGRFRLRVAFKTAYGIIHTALPDAITIV